MDPITREEMYLAAAAGYAVEPPEPITRKEVFLAKLAGMDVETPAPFTRRERFIEEAAMAENNAVIEPLQITENGTYTAPAGVDGYNPVTVDVPSPEVKLQDKTITENGEYTADSSFDGLGKVTVNVAGSGGGSLPAGAYWQEDEVSMPGSYAQTLFMYNGILHCIARVDLTGAKDNGTVYRRENDAWVKVSDIDNAYYVSQEPHQMEYNGKLHFAGNYTNHFVYDGTGAFTKLNNLPAVGYTNSRGLFVQDGKLKFLSYSENSVYIWDEESDTWELESNQISGGTGSYYVYSVNGIIYFTTTIKTTEHKNTNLKICKYENGVCTDLYDTGAGFEFIGYACNGKYVYGTSQEPNKKYKALAKFNLETGEVIYLGRYPNITSSKLAPVQLYGVDKIRLFGINSKSAMYNLILHEVTE